MDSINLVPFIDIMLVLLVIVLMSATFVSEGRIPVALPQSEGVGQKEQSLKTIEITIDEMGKYYLDKDLVNLEQLQSTLIGFPKENLIVLRGDSKSHFEKFVALISMLNKIDRVNVEIEVEQH